MNIVIKSNPNRLRFMAFAMLALSAVLIVLGVYFYIEKDKRLKSEYTLVKCKIIKIDEYERGEVEMTLREINGIYPSFKYYESYDPSEEELDYKLNEIHEVYYYPKDPSKSEIKFFIENYDTAFILFMIGLVFFIDFPIMLFVANVKRKQKNQSQSQHFGIKGSVISE